jgi:hypothetical protein
MRIVGWAVPALDVALDAFYWKRYKHILQTRLQAEFGLMLQKKKGAETKSEQRERNRKEIERISMLVQVNHQRVSASISHISVMNALLVFAYNFVFSANPKTQLIISIEIAVYLVVTMSLIRCLRDFGLADYTDNVDKYKSDFFDEITFRYAILRTCNSIIILGTAVFAALFVFHILPHSVNGSTVEFINRYRDLLYETFQQM